MVCYFFSYAVNNDITVSADQVWVFSSSTSNQQCFDVVIVPDNLVESDETFELTLTTTNEAITLTPATTVITVTNDDCELLFCVLHLLQMVFTSFDFYSVALIEFEQNAYSISEENNQVTVCLTTAGGILERSVTISLSTSGTSAQGL